MTNDLGERRTRQEDEMRNHLIPDATLSLIKKINAFCLASTDASRLPLLPHRHPPCHCTRLTFATSAIATQTLDDSIRNSGLDIVVLRGQP